MIFGSFVECRAAVYARYLTVIRLDQKVGFTVKVFYDLVTAH